MVDFRKAFRRSSGIATAKVSGFTVKVQYPTLRAVKRMFAPYFFRMRSCTGIGVAVPPSYLEPIGAQISDGAQPALRHRSGHCSVALVSGRSEITCLSTLSGWRDHAGERAETGHAPPRGATRRRACCDAHDASARSATYPMKDAGRFDCLNLRNAGWLVSKVSGKHSCRNAWLATRRFMADYESIRASEGRGSYKCRLLPRASLPRSFRPS